MIRRSTLRHHLLFSLALALLPCGAGAAPPISERATAAEMAKLLSNQEAAQAAFSKRLDMRIARQASALFERQARSNYVQPVAPRADAGSADDSLGSLHCTVSPGEPLACRIDRARSSVYQSLRLAHDQ